MRKILLFILPVFLFISCDKETDPFLITKDQVGPLTQNIRINQLDSIFVNDSIVKQINEGEFFTNSNELDIYDQDGKHLLVLEPIQPFDSTSTVGYIRIMDPRFETAEGLNLKSTFKDIVKNYKISRIENTLNAAVIFIDDLNIYVTIDKKELPAELRYDTETPIRASQIPDEAKIKYFMIGWD